MGNECSEPHEGCRAICPALDACPGSKEEGRSRQAANTQLLSAAQNGDLDLLQRALASNADVETTRFADRAGMTPLMLATVAGSVDCVDALLTERADVNAYEDHRLRRPLHFATISGRLEIAKMLLFSKADPERRDLEGHCPLDYIDRLARTPHERRAWAQLFHSKIGAQPSALVESEEIAAAITSISKGHFSVHGLADDEERIACSKSYAASRPYPRAPKGRRLHWEV